MTCAKHITCSSSTDAASTRPVVELELVVLLLNFLGNVRVTDRRGVQSALI